MVSLKNIIKDPFYLSIILTSLLFLGVSIFGFKSDLENLKETKYNITFANLFIHNSLLGFMNMLGVLTLGLYNLYSLFINAFDLGNIISHTIEGTGFTGTMKRFVPHAIFEIPSMIISLSIGFFPMTYMFLKSIGKSLKKFTFAYCAKRIAILYICTLCLNILAALMDSYISGKI